VDAITAVGVLGVRQRCGALPNYTGHLCITRALVDAAYCYRRRVVWFCASLCVQHTGKPCTEAELAEMPLGAVDSFKSQPRRCRVTVLGKLFTPIVPLFNKQRN